VDLEAVVLIDARTGVATALLSGVTGTELRGFILDATEPAEEELTPWDDVDTATGAEMTDGIEAMISCNPPNLTFNNNVTKENNSEQQQQ